MSWISTELATEALEAAVEAVMEAEVEEGFWEDEVVEMVLRMELVDGHMWMRTMFWFWSNTCPGEKSDYLILWLTLFLADLMPGQEKSLSFLQWARGTSQEVSSDDFLQDELC